MKIKLGIALLATTAAILSAPVQAGCDPACKKGENCRYDSTKTPEYWCESTGSGVTKGTKTMPTKGVTKKPTATDTSTIK